jgi:hypothetical protein
MEREYTLLTGALRVFKDFSCSNSTAIFVYDFDHAMYGKLKEEYPIEQVAGAGDEISRALNLLRWCCDNVLHGGGVKDVESIPKTSLGILDYSFQKGYENGVYCRLQAIVFSECCLALGLQSRILHCLPFSPNDFETHVVSIVYSKTFRKWILVDPGNNGYFLDEHGTMLSPLEIRSRLANDQIVNCNHDIYPNATERSFEEKQQHYKYYMAKNMFYFKSPQYNTFGSDLWQHQKTVYCVPVGFDVHDREVAYCEFAIKNCPEHLVSDWRRSLEESRRQTDYVLLDAQQFFSPSL